MIDKLDQDKLRWDLLPLAEIEDAVRVLTYGASKYAPDNWQKINNGKERYYAAMLRHIADWRIRGEVYDKESRFTHLSHALCCLMFVMWHDKKDMENKL